MAQYTSDTNLLMELPASLPPELDSAAERLPFIEQASALADALVGPEYPAGAAGQRFADVSDSPSTPPVIELATRKLAASMVYGALHIVNGGGGSDQRDALHTEAVEWFRRIRDRELPVTAPDGSEVGADDAAVSSTGLTEPVFRMGRYESDGSLIDESEGSLDGLT